MDKLRKKINTLLLEEDRKLRSLCTEKLVIHHNCPTRFDKEIHRLNARVNLLKELLEYK